MKWSDRIFQSEELELETSYGNIQMKMKAREGL